METMPKKKTADFTQGPILGPLLRFTFPIFLAMALQALYGAVDVAIVGRFAQTGDISAVANGADFMNMVIQVTTNLAMGLTVLLGQKLGAGKREEAGGIVGAGIVLFALMALLPTVLGSVFAPGICSLLQVPQEALRPCVTYIRICCLGSISIVGYNLIGSIFRGIGDSKMPLITVAISCSMNIVGDLLLVAVFRMGAAGAAIATVFSQIFSVVLSLIIMKRRGLPFGFRTGYIRPDLSISGQILRLGAPIALQSLLVNVSFLFVMALVNLRGVDASAGVGVAQKIQSFIMLVPISFMQSMAAFVAQNTGARQPKRSKQGMVYGMLVAAAVGVVVGSTVFFRGELVSSIFTSDPGVLKAAGMYLRAFAVECVLTSFMFNLVGYFNGQGKALFVMAQGLIGGIGIRLPVAWIMSRLPGTTVFHIGLATPAATAVQILICMAYFLLCEAKGKKEITA